MNNESPASSGTQGVSFDEPLCQAGHAQVGDITLANASASFEVRTVRDDRVAEDEESRKYVNCEGNEGRHTDSERFA